MKRNMGSLDRVLRIAAAFAITILILAGQLTGTAALIFGVLALVFAATSLVGTCPLYIPLRISTNKAKKAG